MDQPTRIGGLSLDLEGLGIMVYSPFAVEDLAENEDHFTSRFVDPDEIAKQANSGRIAFFGTGSPGRYKLDLLSGYPPNDLISDHDFALRLSLEVRDGTLCVRDIYELMDWTKACPLGQIVRLADGFYHLTVCSSVPASGVLGEDQQVLVFMAATEELPGLHHQGIPMLC